MMAMMSSKLDIQDVKLFFAEHQRWKELFGPTSRAQIKAELKTDLNARYDVAPYVARIGILNRLISATSTDMKNYANKCTLAAELASTPPGMDRNSTGLWLGWEYNGNIFSTTNDDYSCATIKMEKKKPNPAYVLTLNEGAAPDDQDLWADYTQLFRAA
ncbi:hypothetical protein KCU65_g9897, partial [Aureobasidium melanogenum]